MEEKKQTIRLTAKEKKQERRHEKAAKPEKMAKAEKPEKEDRRLAPMMRALKAIHSVSTPGSMEPEELAQARPFSIATGVAAAPFLREIIDRAAAKCHTKLTYQMYPIVNRFFGETITVAGLLTGQDLLAQLKGRDLGTRVLLPQNTLRHGETVFLDDMTLEELSQGLGVPVIPVNQDGFDLFEAIFGV